MLQLDPLPMEEARQFWRDKVKLGPGEFSKLSDEAKVKAFAISGIARGGELDTVFTAMQKAIDQGTTLEAFKAECAEIFQRRGWTGKRAWRIDNIFRTNIQTAYNVGQYKQLMRDKAIFPIWQYSAINDSRTRPTHRAMDGRAWPAGHPMWDMWFPPNGHRCRCSVIGLTKRQAERRGIKVEETDPTNTLVEPIDPGTGNRMPARQLLPDPGFSVNPGKVVYGGMVEQSKGGHLFAELPNLKGPSDYRRPKLANVRASAIPDIDETALLASGLGDDVYRAEFLGRYGEEQVLQDAIGEPVILSLRAFQVYKQPGQPEEWKFGKPGHGELIPMLGDMILQPYEVWLTPQKNPAGRVRLTKRYICLWKTADKQRIGGLLVFEVVNGMFGGVTAFAPMQRGVADLKYLERQRQGVLLYKR